ncbi:MAG TPA: pirin family protein [Thermoanaerobaculia bacterium]|nr:pirin family protein [Thermoanaerobaculia bacterium]
MTRTANPTTPTIEAATKAAAPREEKVLSPRSVERLVAGTATSDGAGVKLTRLLSQPLQRRLDPFLMLDAFGSDDPDDYIAGFPDHPHRGFETVTYMIAGRMKHQDSAGHEGLLENGGVQWMTAGRGVVHSEIPQQEEGVMEGFQLWLNLPGRDKMQAPWYRDFGAADLPRFALGGVTATVIGGESHGIAGAVTREATEPLVLDLRFEPGSRFEQPLASGHNAFVVVYRGSVTVGGKVLGPGRLAILENDPAADGVILEAAVASKALLVAGRPLGEPIAQYGPFVMNTEEEIYQAVSDYRDGRLG